MTLAPEMGHLIRTARMGLMTLSLAVTVALDVVAASHRTDSCCADVLPEVVDGAESCDARSLPANGRNGSADAETLVFFFGESNFRS